MGMSSGEYTDMFVYGIVINVFVIALNPDDVIYVGW